MTRKPLTTEPSGQDLTKRTVFIRVTFGSIGNTRKVPTSAVEVDTDKDLIRVNKTLLDSKELKAIKAADSAIRMWLYNICLPGMDPGVYLLSNEAIPKVTERLREYQNVERPALIDDFAKAYPALLAQARERLRSLFNPAEYPDLEDLLQEFTFGWRFRAFGVPDQLRSISRTIFEEEREKAARDLDYAATEIRAMMRATLTELVDHLRDRLVADKDGKPKVFRPSTVENLQEFLENFNLRNVTDDVELAEQVAKAKEIMRGVNADKLKESDTFRAYIRTGISEVAEQLEVINKPTRKIRDYVA